MKDVKKLEREIKNNISKINDKKLLEKIKSIISPLRKKMDKYDSFLTNINDSMKRHFTFIFNRSIKKEILNDLFDIIDGFENYEQVDKEYTLIELEKIASIHERTFWEKVVSVLRGS